jgi:hypothetical protein
MRSKEEHKMKQGLMMGYNLDELKKLFAETDKMPMTEELPTVRGWLMDAIEKLATPESFDEWIETDDLETLKERELK